MLAKNKVISPRPSKNKWERVKKRRKLPSQSAYGNRIKMSERLREEEVTRKGHLKNIAKFRKHVLPETIIPNFETRDRIITPPSVLVKRRLLESLPSTSAAVETLYDRTRENKSSKWKLTKKITRKMTMS